MKGTVNGLILCAGNDDSLPPSAVSFPSRTFDSCFVESKKIIKQIIVVLCK